MSEKQVQGTNDSSIIDYYDVVANKARLIQQSELLTTVIGDYQLDWCAQQTLLPSSIDLNHEPVLVAACLRELIQTGRASLCSSLECQHFKGLGSRLKCIEKYPYLADQRERFSVGGSGRGPGHERFYRSLDLAERCRVEHLRRVVRPSASTTSCWRAHAGFRHRHHRRRCSPAPRRLREEEAVAEPPCWRVQQGLSQQRLANLTRVGRPAVAGRHAPTSSACTGPASAGGAAPACAAAA
uniref:Uncharacterized protein n=1 Tax=Macrostomum lignano TaxID=282301 RepID=A0A1I8FJQ1_9PLAT